MALADASEHAYLSSTLKQLQDKAWDSKERLEEWIEHGDAPADRHHREAADPAARRRTTRAGGKLLPHPPVVDHRY